MLNKPLDKFGIGTRIPHATASSSKSVEATEKSQLIPPLLSTKELRRLAIKTELMRRGAYTFHSNTEIFRLLPAFIFSPRIVLQPSRHILEKGRLSVLGKADCVCLFWQQTTNAKGTSKGSLWSCWPLLRQYRIKQRGANFFSLGGQNWKLSVDHGPKANADCTVSQRHKMLQVVWQATQAHFGQHQYSI